MKSRRAPEAKATAKPAKSKVVATAYKPKPTSKAKPEVAKAASKAKTAPRAKASKPNRKPAQSGFASKTKASTPPRNVEELAALVDTLHGRLKRADATTRRHVRALDTALKSFESRSDKANASTHAGLVRRIENVKSQLSSLAVDTRVAVRDDLKSALAAEHPRRMAELLFKVDMKLEAAEREQSRAVARLSAHLADMARAMDTRLVAVEAAQARETEARREAVDSLTGRVDAVEAETARAVTDIGERMVGLATRLREDIESVRTEATDDGGTSTAKLLAQAESGLSGRIDELTRNIDVRLERAVRSANDADVRASDVERTQAAHVAELMTRIEGLEHKLAQSLSLAEMRSAAITPITSAQKPVAPMPQASAPQASAAQTSAPAPPTSSGSMPKVIDPQPSGMATASGTSMVEGVSGASTAPVAMPLTTFEAPQASERDSDTPEHFPVEFVPASSASSAGKSTASQIMAGVAPAVPAPAPSPVLPQPDSVHIPQPTAGGMPDFAPVPTGYAPDAQSIAHPNMSHPNMTQGLAGMPRIADSDLPYGDPGYAETGAMSRPGGDARDRAKPGMSMNPRTLKLGAMAAGVALVGVFAASQVIGGPDGTSTDVSPLAANASAQMDGTPSAPSGLAFNAPQGDMAELSMPMMGEGQPGFDTLEAAVASGNPIAQYQMGLIRYEDRDVAGALKLVRAAADQGLAPAQYRLAKFYESGEGVAKDDATAFRLIERAARQGHRIAMHDTAVFYAQGVAGQAADQGRAMEWFDKAGRMGVLDSQFNMAHLLHVGQELGVQQDLESAYVWYAVAAQNGDQDARDRMATLRKGFTPAQLSALETRIANFRTLPMNEAANGVFRDLPWKAPVAAVATNDRESVRRVQTLLNELGYKTGTPDGIAGARTREAIVEFERANDLAETGQTTPALIEELERVAGA